MHASVQLVYETLLFNTQIIKTATSVLLDALQKSLAVLVSSSSVHQLKKKKSIHKLYCLRHYNKLCSLVINVKTIANH